MPSPSELQQVLARLEAIETSIAEVLSLARAAASSADKSADAATKALLSYQALCSRFEVLRREHVSNHPGSSKVPAALLRKPR